MCVCVAEGGEDMMLHLQASSKAGPSSKVILLQMGEYLYLLKHRGESYTAFRSRIPPSP